MDLSGKEGVAIPPRTPLDQPAAPHRLGRNCFPLLSQAARRISSQRHGPVRFLCCSFCCSSNTLGSVGGPSLAFWKLLPEVSASGNGKVIAAAARLIAWICNIWPFF